jgi:predicted transcriptional regulator
MMNRSLVEMAAEIVKAQAAVARMSAEEVDVALIKTFESLRGMKAQEEGVSVETPGGAPAVAPKTSIQRNKVICLECEKEFRQLSRTHLATHGLTSKEYRKKYGFRAGQALTAKSLSAKRRKVAKDRSLGKKLAAATRKKK